MRKFIVLISAAVLLQSCVVSTAAKVVKGVATVGYKAVKGTVKGISWTVSKAKGKIDEDRLDGTWKVVGIYKGPFNDYERQQNPETSFETQCENGFEQIEFNSRKSKFKPVHCSSDKEDWTKYDLEFGKNRSNGERENYIEYNSRNYISVIDVSSKNLILEGNLTMAGTQLYLLEKVK